MKVEENERVIIFPAYQIINKQYDTEKYTISYDSDEDVLVIFSSEGEKKIFIAELELAKSVFTQGLALVESVENYFNSAEEE